MVLNLLLVLLTIILYSLRAVRLHTVHPSYLSMSFKIYICSVYEQVVAISHLLTSSLSGSTALLLGLGLSFSLLIYYTVGRTPWTGDQPVARPLPTHRTTQTKNKSTQTSMPPVGFESTISMLERAKTLHADHCAAAVIGII
jgi:hypothetical protein